MFADITPEVFYETDIIEVIEYETTLVVMRNKWSVERRCLCIRDFITNEDNTLHTND